MSSSDIVNLGRSEYNKIMGNCRKEEQLAMEEAYERKRVGIAGYSGIRSFSL